MAIERGPLVYCVEQADQPGSLDPDDTVLDPAAPLTVRDWPELLGGVTTVIASGRASTPGLPSWWPYASHGTYPCQSDETVELTAVPYNAWANRGPGAMRIWMPTAT